MYYRRTWPTQARARLAVAEYIEVFYNRTPYAALTDHHPAAATAA
jgi:hypothetical protein